MMDASLTKPRKLAASLSYRVAMRRHCLSLAKKASIPSAACRRCDHRDAGICDGGGVG